MGTIKYGQTTENILLLHSETVYHKTNRMNKRIAFVAFSILVCCAAFAQQNNHVAIAPFKITLVNGKSYTYQQIKKNIPTVLVYFSPTCDHCKAFTKELLTYDKKLHNKQIIMIGYEPLKEMKVFDSLFHLSSKPYLKIGTEGYTFIVQKYYSVQRFPFVAMYNKSGKLTKTIPFVTEPEAAAKEISTLQ